MLLKHASNPSEFDKNLEFRDMLSSSRKSQIEAQENPKIIVDNQMTKFYSKSSKGKMDVKVR